MFDMRGGWGRGAVPTPAVLGLSSRRSWLSCVKGRSSSGLTFCQP